MEYNFDVSDSVLFLTQYSGILIYTDIVLKLSNLILT